MQRFIQVLDAISHQEVVQRFIQALDAISHQEVVITMTRVSKPEHHPLRWKALAEAHLRERVSNPHDYRALSIELEGMKQAGLNWEDEFNHSIAKLTSFLNDLYGVDDLKFRTLWNRLEYFPERFFYQIQEATEYWRLKSSKMVVNGRQ